MDSYQLISTIIKIYYDYKDEFHKIMGNALLTGTPTDSKKILTQVKIEPIYIDSYNSINITTLEEYEQLRGLDPNNRPFKIITEEEFYKDLTEEEARKIASEL